MKKILLASLLSLLSVNVFSQNFHEILKKAEKQDAAAQCVVGLCYLNGNLGVEKDETKAVKWFQNSASLGHALGQYNLAQCLLSGIGISRNYLQHNIWLHIVTVRE